MNLPKINYPLFDVTIPSTGAVVKMRPFLVKEEKILLLAQTTGNPKDVIDSITQVVNNCVIDPSFDTTKLTTFDIEYMFVKLRSRSVNNKIDILYRDPDDEKQYQIEIDLDKVEVQKHPEHSNKIDINSSVGIILRYPHVDMVEKLSNVSTEVDLYFEVVKYCIEKIYDEEQVYNVADYTDEDLNEFMSTLDVSTFKKIQKFIDTMPKLYYEASYVTESGKDKKIVLQSLNDFFMLG